MKEIAGKIYLRSSINDALIDSEAKDPVSFLLFILSFGVMFDRTLVFLEIFLVRFSELTVVFAIKGGRLDEVDLLFFPDVWPVSSIDVRLYRLGRKIKTFTMNCTVYRH
jgi:hypothetical protein